MISDSGNILPTKVLLIFKVIISMLIISEFLMIMLMCHIICMLLFQSDRYVST